MKYIWIILKYGFKNLNTFSEKGFNTFYKELLQKKVIEMIIFGENNLSFKHF